MQQWEYNYLFFNFSDVNDSLIRMGYNGWELVSVLPYSDKYSAKKYIGYFKRPWTGTIQIKEKPPEPKKENQMKYKSDGTPDVDFSKLFG